MKLTLVTFLSLLVCQSTLLGQEERTIKSTVEQLEYFVDRSLPGPTIEERRFTYNTQGDITVKYNVEKDLTVSYEYDGDRLARTISSDPFYHRIDTSFYQYSANGDTMRVFASDNLMEPELVEVYDEQERLIHSSFGSSMKPDIFYSHEDDLIIGKTYDITDGSEILKYYNDQWDLVKLVVYFQLEDDDQGDPSLHKEVAEWTYKRTYDYANNWKTIVRYSHGEPVSARTRKIVYYEE